MRANKEQTFDVNLNIEIPILNVNSSTLNNISISYQLKMNMT